MLTLMTICFGITNIIIPKVIDRIIPKYTILIAISSILLSGGCIAFTLVSHQMRIWILTPFAGGLFGATCISSEMCILEIQPKQHSGKVNGIKSSLKALLRAFGVLGVGVCWDTDIGGDALWYGSAICALLVAILTFPMMYLIATMDPKVDDSTKDMTAQ